MDIFIAQLKQRQVFKVATIYAISAWPLIQIADLSIPALGLPDSVMTLLLMIFVAGFPVSLLFAWFFNFTSQGIVWAKKSVDNENSPQVNFQATIVVVGSLLIVLIVTLGTQYFFDERVATQTAATRSNETVEQPLLSSAITKNKKESIAILPFTPFSNDPEDEFFADGMVEELLNLLSKIPDLQVAARTSSFAYKKVTNKTIQEIGRELGVDTILEGSIRKNDTTNKIRITAQLIKVSTGEHLWSETYDREFNDIFKIQDDIANAVVKKMKITLLGESSNHQFIAETNSVDAMVAYGKGKKELDHRTVTSINLALKHFNDAINLDNNYARVYVGIADANILLALYGNLSPKQAQINAQQAISKALAIDDKLAAAYASQGLLLSTTDNEKAEQSFKKAISLNPNYAMAYMWYGSLLRSSGKLTEAQKLFTKAFELDPKSPTAAYNLAWGHYLAGSEKKAMELFSYIIGNDPYYPGAYNLVGEILSNRGRLDEATNMYKRALEIDPINKSAVYGLTIAAMDMNNIESTQQWFDYIDNQVNLFSLSEINFLKGRFYLTQGDIEQAISTFSKVQFDHSKIKMNNYIQGEIALRKGNYENAIITYEKLQQQDKGQEGFFYLMDNGQAAIHLAFAYKQSDQQTKFNNLITNYEQFLQKSNKKPSNNPTFYYSMAMIKSLQQKNDQAFYYLQGAIDAGWVQVWQAELEPAFNTINKEQQFVLMMGGVTARLANMRTRLKAEDEFLLADFESTN